MCAPARSESPSSKSAGPFLPPYGQENINILEFCSGGTPRARHIGDHSKTIGSISSISKAQSNRLHFPGFHFAEAIMPISRLRPKLSQTSESIGFLGQLREGKVDAPGAAFVAEFDLDLALSGADLEKTFREIERFPSITRDIAMIVPDEISHEKILRIIEEPREPLLERVDLFDLFTEQIGAAGKSLAYRLTYRDRSRTLTNEEVTAAHAKIRERLKRELGVTLRE